MTPALHTYFVNELQKAIEVLGPRFEAFGQRMLDFMSPVPLQHPGLNVTGSPVGHTVDSSSNDGSFVGEYTAEEKSFMSPFTKLRDDWKHARGKHPQAKTIHLLSNQPCGPSVRTRITNLVARAKNRLGITLQVWDSLLLAEWIVEEVLDDDVQVEALADFLGPLKKLRDEYAATNLVPEETAGYHVRPVLEQRLLREALSRKVLGIAGVSGAGKSAVAAAIGRAARISMNVIWLPAASIASLADLKAMDCERRGRRVNLLHILRSQASLLILDDLRVPLPRLDLAATCGPDSAVLITRQVAEADDMPIPLFDEREAAVVLNRDTPHPCPPACFDKIWQTVGGHPLAVRLLNSAAKVESWEDVVLECDAIAFLSDEDRTQSLVDRILARIRPALRREIAFFKWCESNRVDRGFARRVLRPAGLRRLDDFCLLAADRADVLRMHDIVASSIRAAPAMDGDLTTVFEYELVEYIRHLGMAVDDDIQFHNFCDVHRALLERRAQQGSDRAPYLFCLLQTWNPDEVREDLIGDPTDAATCLLAAGRNDSLSAFAIIESVEAIYRRRKRTDVDKAKELLSQMLPLFDSLAAVPAFAGSATQRILHHKAKALNILNRGPEAIVICRAILAGSHASSATKLLLARMLAKGDERAEARDLYFQLLREANRSDEKREVSVTLAAFAELNRSVFNVEFDDLWAEFGLKVGAWIIATAARGLDQAYHAFAICATSLSWKDPEELRRWLAQFPPVALDPGMSLEERVSCGTILTAAGQATENPAKATALLEEALAFFDSIQKPPRFVLQKKVKALNLLKRYGDALALFEKPERAKWGPFEWFEYSKALHGLARQGAHEAATTALENLRPDQEKFRAALLDHRATVGKAVGASDWRADLEKAHDLARDKKFKAHLAAKLTHGSETPVLSVP